MTSSGTPELSGMYEVLKDFAGPSATVIASVTAVVITGYFASQQVRLAKEKLRHDLFDRRLAIFTSIFDFYDAMISWEGTPEQRKARARFFRAYHESGFLFKQESGIEELLKELNDKGLKVIGFKEHAEQIKVDKEVFLKLFNETQEIQTHAFADGLARLKNAMSEYLNFHDV